MNQSLLTRNDTEDRNTGTVPGFWITSNKAVAAYLTKNVFRGQVSVIGYSAGKRPVYAYEFGESEVGPQTVSFSSAHAARKPELFTQQGRKKKPSLLIYSAIHGAEVEGTAALINLIHIIEHGCDLRGKKWQGLSRMAKYCRLVIVPLSQPDGRERFALDSMTGQSLATFQYYAHGMWKDGTPCSYPFHKETLPLPLDRIGHLGAYFNDNGVNCQHDDFFGTVQPETAALIALAHAERPDCILSCHACEADPGFSGPHMTNSAAAEAMTTRIAEAVLAKHLAAHLRPYEKLNVKRHSYFYLQDILYMASGALPLLYEFPHGAVNVPFTQDEIVDLGLILFEELMRFGLKTHFMPRF